MRFLYFLVAAVGVAACSSPETVVETPTALRPFPPLSVAPEPLAPPAMAYRPDTSVVTQPTRRESTATTKPALPSPARPTTFADAVPDAAGAAPPAVADTAAVGAAKTAQTFWIQPGRDTVLFAAEGTTIGVPARAFVLATAGSAPAGPVEVQLREFYSMPDILLNNLSTSSSHGLLETGGMLHLAARTATGQPCTLRPGAELLLRMPAARPKTGMQLYTGVRTAGHRLDWQRPRPALKPTDFEPLGPEVRGNEAQLRKSLRRQLTFSAEEARRLRTAQTPAQRKALRQASRFSGRKWVEYGRLVVDINNQGTVVNAAADGILNPALRDQLLGAARRLPAFEPAYLCGPVGRRSTAAAPRSYLTIVRKRRPAAPVPLPRLPVAGTWLLDVGFTRDGQVVFPWPSISFASIGMGASNRQSFRADSARRLLRRADARTLQAVSLDSLSGYLFSAASLGWANCDRTGQFASQRVYFGVETDAPHTRVSLVFRRVRAVVASDGEQPGSHVQLFHSCPVGEPATLVAIKRENGLTYLALKEVMLNGRIERGLAFRPVSPEELRSALAQIDQ